MLIKKIAYSINDNYFPSNKLFIHAIKIDTKHLYIPVPKNMCTTLKYCIYNKNNGVDFIKFNKDIHQFFWNEYNNYHLALNLKKYEIICVIRDPVSRFVSAFKNRVLEYGEGVDSFKGAKVTISNFIDNFDLIKDNNKSIEHHFRSQASFLPLNRKTLNIKYIDIRNSSEIEKYFPGYVGYNFKQSKPDMLNDSEFDKVKKFVRLRYADDYDLIRDI